MKKKIIILISVLALFFVYFFAKPHVVYKQNISVVPSVSVTFNTGSTIATVSGIIAPNAFQALSEAAKKQQLEVKTKQYDFGVFIEQIGALANTKEKAWIYSVNGTVGEVASDKYLVKQNDVVEWKYTTPLY